MNKQSALPEMPDEREELTGLPERIHRMHRVYGRLTGYQCKTCAHLRRKKWDKVYFKCDLNKDTNGPGTDWRVRWPACGKWEPRDE